MSRLGDASMARRRPSFGTYARRRWRALGAVVVLLLGAVLVLAVTDRGHDPRWHAQTGEVDQLDVAPDGSVVYALVREGGNLSALQARAGDDGRLLWESPVTAPRARLRAAPDGVVLATDFPSPFLTRFGADGSLRFQVAFEGNPHALDVDGATTALALLAPGNPILLFEGERLVRRESSPGTVGAIDLENGRVAVGTSTGAVWIQALDGTRLFEASFPMDVRSLRLSTDGGLVALGGAAQEPGGDQGLVAIVDLSDGTPERWRATTASAIGLVEMDRAGVVVVAVEDRPLAANARAYEGATGATLWVREVGGNVFRDDAGAFGSLAVAPDARAVAYATLRGQIQLVRATDGEPRWSYGTRGAPILEFADGEPDVLVAAGRLSASRLYETTFSFSLMDEPPIADARLMAFVAVVAALALAASLLGFGYWRARRST